MPPAIRIRLNGNSILSTFFNFSNFKVSTGEPNIATMDQRRCLTIEKSLMGSFLGSMIHT
jgi:hypothetical protein